MVDGYIFGWSIYYIQKNKRQKKGLPVETVSRF